MLGIGTSCVLVTVVMVLDVQTRLNYSGNLHVPAKAPMKYSFRQRQLQRMSNGSRDASLAISASGQLSVAGDDPTNKDPPGGGTMFGMGPSSGMKELLAKGTEPPDPYHDLQEIVAKVEKRSTGRGPPRNHWNPTVGELLGRDSR